MLYQKHIKKILSTKKDQMKKGKKLNRKKGGPENGGSEVKKGGCKC